MSVPEGVAASWYTSRSTGRRAAATAFRAAAACFGSKYAVFPALRGWRAGSKRLPRRRKFAQARDMALRDFVPPSFAYPAVAEPPAASTPRTGGRHRHQEPVEN